MKRLTLVDAGFDTGAAAHHRYFKKNYRTSRQILRAASRLASHYGKMEELVLRFTPSFTHARIQSTQANSALMELFF